MRKKQKVETKLLTNSTKNDKFEVHKNRTKINM